MKTNEELPLVLFEGYGALEVRLPCVVTTKEFDPVENLFDIEEISLYKIFYDPNEEDFFAVHMSYRTSE